MVTSRQRQGWRVAALLLSLLLLGGCEKISTLIGDQGDPIAGGTVESGSAIDYEPTVDFTVYIDGEPVDTISVPQSLLEEQADAANDEGADDEASETAEEPPGDEAASAGDEIGIDDSRADELEITATVDVADAGADPAGDGIVTPEILLARERAIAAQMVLNATIAEQDGVMTPLGAWRGD